MSAHTGIQWTDATTMTDRGGRRVRTYQRKDASRPGVQLRRRMAAEGWKWCRSCAAWLPLADVTKNGLCRPHENADYRRRYADGGRDAIAQRVHARRRGVRPLGSLAQTYLTDQCGGACVYCGKPADSWDHVVPISKGGETIVGNIVPACTSCNSAKRDRDLDAFLSGRGCSAFLVDLIIMAEVSLG